MAGRAAARDIARFLLLLCFAGALLAGCRGRGRDSVEPAPRALAAAEVRQPAVAGQYYPGDSGELVKTVEALLASARSGAPTGGGVTDGAVVGVVAPHAGYVYSGLTAARAFAPLSGRRYDAVLLLGSPHRVTVHGAAVYPGKGLATPLGTVEVEQGLARAVASAGPLFRADAAPHAPEHSLEVELPFLQATLPGVPVVAVLVMAAPAELEALASRMADAVASWAAGGRSVLVVVSTDLSHYPARADAEASDRAMLDALCSLDAPALLAENERALGRRIPGLECAMCGLDAAYVGMVVARKLGASRGLVLGASTSAEAAVPGADARRVVGYGAAAFVGHVEPARARFEPLGRGEQEFLLALARRSIEASLARRSVPEPVVPEAYRRHLGERRGVFVTLTIDGELRGCIGTHEPAAPLAETVREMALASAFRDPRFRPLGRGELGRTRIELSVYLTGIEPIGSADEYVPGRHGIILRVGDRAATFLPQVPLVQGWDRTRTLGELCRKAGLPADAWRGPDARLSVYETQVFSEAAEDR